MRKRASLARGAAIVLAGMMLLGGCTMRKGDQVDWQVGVFSPADDLDPKAELSYFYRNPSRINNIGDPFIIRDEKTGQYAAIATSASIGYYAWPSDDLVNWGTRKWAYERPADPWSTDSYWAPEVIYHDDLYYMFYTARNKSGRLVISVATAESAAGPYTDVSAEPLFDPGYAIIDASVFIDDDGQAYMYYARDISEHKRNGQGISEIYGVKLTGDLLAFDGEPVVLTTPDQRWENPLAAEAWNEGPILLKHADHYFLAYSANPFFSSAYGVGYAVSSSPLGPYTKAEENPILSAGNLEGVSGSGHHSYVYSPDGSELFTAYHTHTNPAIADGNRQLSIDRVVFTSDTTMAIGGPTLSWQPAPSNDKMRVLKAEDLELAAEVAPLFDHLQAIHDRDQNRDVSLAVDGEGLVELEIKLKEKRSIRGLTLAAGSGHHANIASAKLRVGTLEYDLGAFLPEGPASATLAGLIEAVEVDSLTFVFEAEDKTKPVVLSEIFLIEDLVSQE